MITQETALKLLEALRACQQQLETYRQSLGLIRTPAQIAAERAIAQAEGELNQ